MLNSPASLYHRPLFVRRSPLITDTGLSNLISEIRSAYAFPVRNYNRGHTCVSRSSLGLKSILKMTELEPGTSRLSMLSECAYHLRYIHRPTFLYVFLKFCLSKSAKDSKLLNSIRNYVIKKTFPVKIFHDKKKVALLEIFCFACSWELK